VFNHAPHVVVRCLESNNQMVTNVLHCILHVEVPDGSYTLVLADVNEGAGGDMHYVTVEQDPDQSPEVVCPLVLTKASLGLFINLYVPLHF
jgi:hypothetical protein